MAADENDQNISNKMDAIINGMAELEVQDTHRPSEQLKMPIPFLVGAFTLLVNLMTKCTSISKRVLD